MENGFDYYKGLLNTLCPYLFATPNYSMEKLNYTPRFAGFFLVLGAIYILGTWIYPFGLKRPV